METHNTESVGKFMLGASIVLIVIGVISLVAAVLYSTNTQTNSTALATGEYKLILPVYDDEIGGRRYVAYYQTDGDYVRGYYGVDGKFVTDYIFTAPKVDPVFVSGEVGAESFTPYQQFVKSGGFFLGYFDENGDFIEGYQSPTGEFAYLLVNGKEL